MRLKIYFGRYLSVAVVFIIIRFCLTCILLNRTDHFCLDRLHCVPAFTFILFKTGLRRSS